jgi:hypothetical protein
MRLNLDDRSFMVRATLRLTDLDDQERDRLRAELGALLEALD